MARRCRDTGCGSTDALPWSSGRGELLLHLPDRGIRQGGTVGEDDGRDGLVAPIHRLHERGGGRIGLDVHLGEGDPLTTHLGLEALAVATPDRAVHRERWRLIHGTTVEQEGCPRSNRGR